MLPIFLCIFALTLAQSYNDERNSNNINQPSNQPPKEVVLPNNVTVELRRFLVSSRDLCKVLNDINNSSFGTGQEELDYRLMMLANQIYYYCYENVDILNSTSVREGSQQQQGSSGSSSSGPSETAAYYGRGGYGGYGMGGYGGYGGYGMGGYGRYRYPTTYYGGMGGGYGGYGMGGGYGGYGGYGMGGYGGYGSTSYGSSSGYGSSYGSGSYY